jgi:homoserine/homoserine lactone efflux protein
LPRHEQEAENGMSLQVWLAFIVAAMLISLSPGAGAISCMASGMRYGYRRSLANIAGMQLGVALQLVVVGIGLGALLATSTVAFNLVKAFGVAYLCYLGWKQFRTPAVPVEIGSQSQSPGTPQALFVHGFVVNASNPKATIFLLAVLPQFIDAHAPALPQYLVCMATLAAVDIVVMSGYALFAARVLRLLREPGQIRWMNRGFGTLFVLAGGFLALFRRA